MTDEHMTSAVPAEPKPAGGATQEPAVVAEHVEVIKAWEQDVLSARSSVEQLADRVARTAAGGPVLLLHVLWFTFWITANLKWIPGVTPFDPYPFSLLTILVSLEAIFLTLIVVASQNRLARQSEKRGHLDLQIDLLAEREMTAALQLLQDIARHLHVSTSVTPEHLRDLAKPTDLRGLTQKMEEIPAAEGTDPSADSRGQAGST